MNNNTNRNANFCLDVDIQLNEKDKKFLFKKADRLQRGKDILLRFVPLAALMLYDITSVAIDLPDYILQIRMGIISLEMICGIGHSIVGILLTAWLMCYLDKAYRNFMRDITILTFDPLFTASRGLMRMSFGTDGFTLYGGGYLAVLPYRKLSKVVQCAKGFIFIMNDDASLFLPARFISKEDAEALANVLTDSMGRKMKTEKVCSDKEKQTAVYTDTAVIGTAFTPTRSECDGHYFKGRITIRVLYIITVVFLSVLTTAAFAAISFGVDLNAGLFAVMLLAFAIGLGGTVSKQKIYKKYDRGVIIQNDNGTITYYDIKTGRAISFKSWEHKVIRNGIGSYGCIINGENTALIIPDRVFDVKYIKENDRLSYIRPAVAESR